MNKQLIYNRPKFLDRRKRGTSKSRRLKREAHNWAALIWGDLNSAFGNPARMYTWMQQNTRTGHIGSLNDIELAEVIRKLKRLASK